MKSNFKYFGITWLVGFILFNAVVFLIPNEVFGITRFDKAVFWIAYALIVVAFAAQIFTAHKFEKSLNKERVFMNISLLSTGYMALIVSLIVGAVFMVIPVIPAWIGAIVCLLVTGYFIFAAVSVDVVVSEVAAVGQKVAMQTEFMKLTVVDAETIVAMATTAEIKAEAKKVYEALRYSDYMSVPALADVEASIAQKMDELKVAVASSNIEQTQAVCSQLLLLIKARNTKCKALK